MKTKNNRSFIPVFTSAVVGALALNSQAADFYTDFTAGAVIASDYEASIKGTGIKTDFDLGTGFALNVDFGLHVSEQLSLGVTIGYSEIPIDGVVVGGVPVANVDGTITLIPVIAFAEVKAPITEKLAANMGFGFGISHINAEPEGNLALGFGEDDTTAFTIQFRGGIDYEFTENASAGLDYRFQLQASPSFDALSGDSVFTHFIGASVKIRF